MHISQPSDIKESVSASVSDTCCSMQRRSHQTSVKKLSIKSWLAHQGSGIHPKIRLMIASESVEYTL